MAWRTARPSGSVSPLIPVVDAANSGDGDDLGILRRPGLNRARLRRVLVQRQVASVFVVVGYEFRDQPAGMGLVEDDNVVQQLPAERQCPAFTDSILPRRPVAGEDRFGTSRFQPCRDAGELAVAVVDEVADARVVEEDLTELLQNPGGRGMGGDVEVKDAPPVVVDDEESVQDLEGRGRDGQEVHGRDVRHVVLEERLPSLDLVRVGRAFRQVSGDGGLAEVDAQLEQFGVDAWGAPSRVVCGHLADEGPGLSGDPRSPRGFARA